MAQDGNFFLTNNSRTNTLSFRLLNVSNLAKPKRNHLVNGVEVRHGIDVLTVDWTTQTAYVFVFHDTVYSIDLKTDQKIGRQFKLVGEKPPERVHFWCFSNMFFCVLGNRRPPTMAQRLLLLFSNQKRQNNVHVKI